MSFFQYEPHVRQKGFQLPSPAPDTPSFAMTSHSYIADAFRKFPAADSSGLDFGDELTSLIERPPSARPHNIFDISAPTQPAVPSSASSTASSAFPPHDPPPGFNSTLPALNSSMRYEPHPDHHHPPSSFPATQFRHTPSPIHHPSAHPHHSRSRSSSRPPDAASGPARTSTRSRRNNSVSSTSPPPRPQAIVIPGTHSHHRMAASLGGAPQGGGAGWFMNSHSSASDFSLPTPDSVHAHPHPLHVHAHSHSHSHQGYTPFSLSSPTDMHLPPLSHSLSHTSHIPQLGGAGSVPKDPPHGHLSLSSSIGSNGTIVNGINGLGIAGLSPPHSHAVVGTPQNNPAQTAAEKQAAIANEKRRRRRESHNAVERRRRDNINEKISELATLIPECMLDVGNANGTNLDDQLLSPISPVDVVVVPGLKKEDDAIAAAAAAASAAASASEAGVVKANKGMILRKSVEYIRYLQQLVTAQGARNRELEQELKAYRGGSSIPASPDASPTATATTTTTTTTTTPSELMLASEANAASFNGGGGGGFTLPTTNEDDELMEMDIQQRGRSEESLSPAASGGSLEEQEAERGRTRDVRRAGLTMEQQQQQQMMGVQMAMET